MRRGEKEGTDLDMSVTFCFKGRNARRLKSLLGTEGGVLGYITWGSLSFPCSNPPFLIDSPVCRAGEGDGEGSGNRLLFFFHNAVRRRCGIRDTYSRSFARDKPASLVSEQQTRSGMRSE